MQNTVNIVVPDLGGANDVEVIEVLVKVGDVIEVEDSLITLESDKASMDVPSSHSGKIVELKVSVGDSVNENDVIVLLEAKESAQSSSTETQSSSKEPSSSPTNPEIENDFKRFETHLNKLF